MRRRSRRNDLRVQRRRGRLPADVLQLLRIGEWLSSWANIFGLDIVAWLSKCGRRVASLDIV